MINSILSSYAKLMEQFISSYEYQPEGLVEVGDIGSCAGEEPCKIRIALYSMEREIASGMASPKSFPNEKTLPVLYPPLFMNLNIVIAAVFSEKRYKDSLTFLSLAILFLQSAPYFELESGERYTIEVVNLPLQDQSNIWTLLGGHYYPSVICKIRRMTFDAGEIKQSVHKMRNIETDIK